MNKKISGAKLVLVPIRQVGKNYFPYVEDLKNRYIKYIDFHPAQYLPGTTDTGVTYTSEGDFYVTLANEIGNKLLFNRMPLEDFAYIQTNGVRTPIGAKLSMQNCYVECTDSSYVGQTMALVFYYDLPQFSARNCTDILITDSVSVPITTATFYNSFPDEERMAGKRFRFVNFSPTNTTPENQPGLISNQNDCYLTLRKGSYNVLENVPLTVLYQVTKLEKLEFANIIFDLQSSYITVGGAGTLTSVIGKHAFFNLTYEQ